MSSIISVTRPACHGAPAPPTPRAALASPPKSDEPLAEHYDDLDDDDALPDSRWRTFSGRGDVINGVGIAALVAAGISLLGTPASGLIALATSGSGGNPLPHEAIVAAVLSGSVSLIALVAAVWSLGRLDPVADRGPAAICVAATSVAGLVIVIQVVTIVVVLVVHPGGIDSGPFNVSG